MNAGRGTMPPALARTAWTVLVGAGLASFAVVAGAAEGDTVALRLKDGHFLQTAADGWIRPGGYLPAAEARFDLQNLGKKKYVLRSASGRLLTPVAPDGRWLHVDAADSEILPRHKLLLLPVDGNRVSMRAEVGRLPLHFDVRAKPEPGPSPAKPRPYEIVEIYRVIDLPAPLQAILLSVVQTVMEESLQGQKYDRTRVKKIERWADVWSPTLKDLGYKKRQRLLATEERQRIEAEIDGKPDLTITHLAYLRGQQATDVGLLTFGVAAKVPFRGAVGYQIPNLLSATVRFEATATLELAGELRLKKEGNGVALSPPEVRELKIDLDLRHISNDLVDAAREPIEDVVNREIRDNDARIRKEANRALKKAIDAQKFQNPLLRFLLFP